MSIATKGPERKLLIVDDDEGLRRQLGWAFADYAVLTAGDRQEAMRQVQGQSPPVVTLDLGLPPHADGPSEGLATLEAIIAHSPGTKVIVVTGQDDRAHALRAVALGAYDFYQKPIDADVLHLIVDRAYNLAKLEAENRRLSDRQGRSPLRGLITAASSMLNVCQTVERVAPIGVNVCILGESGTGKELLARALHELSPRAGRRFVAINCAAIPENLLESELFGHEKGAFTGAVRQVIGKIELADRGTLFLDEIGDMPMPLQGKLLRFLQERRLERVGGREEIAVDVRIVCATHRDMEDLTRNNGFRQDLYFRLKEIELHVPALRERAGDTALLAHHFLHSLSAQYGRNLRGFTSEALASIGAYEWPGNVRELENRMKRAVIMADSDVINVADLDLPLRTGGGNGGAATLREARERAERQALTQALANSDGNVSAASKALGISRPTLYALMRQYGVRE